MVRTKADAGSTKAVGGKAPRKNFNAASESSRSSSDGSKGKEYSGGNHYHPRETPEWQKPITSFFVQQSAKSEVSTALTSPNKLDTDAATSNVAG